MDFSFWFWVIHYSKAERETPEFHFKLGLNVENHKPLYQWHTIYVRFGFDFMNYWNVTEPTYFWVKFNNILMIMIYSTPSNLITKAIMPMLNMEN